MKYLKNAMGCSVNDVLTGVFAGAIRRYCAEMDPGHFDEYESKEESSEGAATISSSLSGKKRYAYVFAF